MHSLIISITQLSINTTLNEMCRQWQFPSSVHNAQCDNGIPASTSDDTDVMRRRRRRATSALSFNTDKKLTIIYRKAAHVRACLFFIDECDRMQWFRAMQEQSQICGKCMRLFTGRIQETAALYSVAFFATCVYYINIHSISFSSIWMLRFVGTFNIKRWPDLRLTRSLARAHKPQTDSLLTLLTPHGHTSTPFGSIHIQYTIHDARSSSGMVRACMMSTLINKAMHARG